jgi:putative membrane protein
MKSTDRILVLNVDRDNDLGDKAGIKGPLVGRESVLKAGTEMGLKEPESSDFNGIFQALKTYDEMKKNYTVEVAVITGDRDVGIKSDRMIGEQLKSVLGKFNANFVVLVTDGSEDEHVIPVIQSKVHILSVKRVVVRQADELQSMYFKIKDFVHETLDDPKVSRLLFGIPAIILIIYAMFGLEGWRLMLGVVGFYLFLRGFKLDRYVLGAFAELESSFEHRRFAFFGYVVGLAFAVLATYRGYFGALSQSGMGMFEIAAGFISQSAYLYFMGGTIAWVSRNVSVKKRRARKIAAIPLFGFAITLVAYMAADLILNPASTGFNFILSIVIGFGMLLGAIILEWKG